MTELWPAKRPMWIGIVTMILLLGGFGGWIFGAQIKGAVITSGQIEVEKNRQIIQHPDGGIVKEILVQEGELVAKDTILLRLIDDELQSERAVVEGQLFELLARRGRLEAERDDSAKIAFDLMLDAADPALLASQQRLLTIRHETELGEIEQLGQQAKQIQSQIAGIAAQTNALTEQLNLLDEELLGQESLLERGLSQAPRVLALRRERAGVAGRIAETAASKAQAEERGTEIELQILSIPAERREAAISELREVQSDEIELRERLRSVMDRLDRTDIRAPLGGTIYDLTVLGSNAVIQSAEPLMYIIPHDRPLVITVEVSIRDIDQVFIDQPATVRFSAFDQRNTPELEGKVVSVSADAFEDSATRQSFYRAEIQLNPDELGRLQDGQRLVPGMPVDAFMATRDRRPVDYLIQPIADYFTKAFREG